MVVKVTFLKDSFLRSHRQLCNSISVDHPKVLAQPNFMAYNPKTWKIWPIVSEIGIKKQPLTISLVEVLLGLLQSLQPVLDLQTNLRIMKMLPSDSSWPKTWG